MRARLNRRSHTTSAKEWRWQGSHGLTGALASSSNWCGLFQHGNCTAGRNEIEQSGEASKQLKRSRLRILHCRFQRAKLEKLGSGASSATLVTLNAHAL